MAADFYLTSHYWLYHGSGVTKPFTNYHSLVNVIRRRSSLDPLCSYWTPASSVSPVCSCLQPNSSWLLKLDPAVGSRGLDVTPAFWKRWGHKICSAEENEKPDWIGRFPKGHLLPPSEGTGLTVGCLIRKPYSWLQLLLKPAVDAAVGSRGCGYS